VAVDTVEMLIGHKTAISDFPFDFRGCRQRFYCCLSH